MLNYRVRLELEGSGVEGALAIRNIFVARKHIMHQGLVSYLNGVVR